ncbi:amino acid ABC transporter ATP-binding protein [Aeromonas taiwanensis]|uniref:amino acid ABC transporter ATP-binding protein n=1 Tax=Aeromonas taiwanensis TaxID=633417 RepID=UPI00398A3EB8
MSEHAAITIQKLSKHFDNVEVLRDINLTVRKGEVVSILGSSGSGKSTLLRCMNWLEQPDRGAVYLGDQRLGIDPASGKPMGNRQLAALRERIGMVFQSFNLWPHLTVLQNVTEALCHVKKLPREQAVTIARTQLEKVGMLEKADAFPITLSGGQKQRVAIARSLAMSPEVLLFDEPTSALDPERVGEVLAVMKALSAEGYTMVVVTHEMEFARAVSDQVVFLEKGKLIEQAPPEEFFLRPRSERVRQFLQTVRQ